MISIVICSRRPDISAELRRNIAESVGCKYEIIVVDNAQRKYSISQAYNKAVGEANGNVLCFMHDDIVMRTSGWGKTVAEELEDDSIGMIGVAGSHLMPSAPMYWWSSPFIAQYSWGIDGAGKTKKNITVDTFNGELADVAVVDGMFFCIPSKLFDTLRFDEALYKDFHAYDMDMSMQVQAMGKRVCVTRGFVVEHLWSESQFQNKKYMDLLDGNMELFYEKWKAFLPIVRGLNEPKIVIDRVNNLMIAAYDAKKVRRSRPYRFWKASLRPFKWIKIH